MFDSWVFVAMRQTHMTMPGSCVRTITIRLHCAISHVTMVCMNIQHGFLFRFAC